MGHHVGDVNREYYRSKKEEQMWKTERDPVKLRMGAVTEVVTSMVDGLKPEFEKRPAAPSVRQESGQDSRKRQA